MNLGAELVGYAIELHKQWMPIHKYLYFRGEGIISDAVYDSVYQPHEIELGLVGTPDTMPTLPRYASRKEEADHFGLPLWDVLAEFRKRNK